MPVEAWGDTVVSSRYAGHDGLVYEPRPRSLAGLLDACERFGDRDFLVQGDRRVSFAAFRRAVRAGADLLAEHGVGPGSLVVLFAYNSPAWVLGLWSSWVAGAVPVLANRWWSDEELAQAIEAVQPSLVVTDRSDLDELGVDVLTVGELDRCFDDLRAEPALGAVSVPDEDSTAMVLFTSGSSGRAKGVCLSHRSVLANQHNLLLGSGRLPHQQRPDAPPTVNLVSVPLFHIGGVSHLVTQVVAGGRLVFLRGRFDPDEVLRLIQDEHVTSWGGVPTMAKRVLEHPSFDRYDLSSLRSFPLGGAPVPGELLDRVRDRLPRLSRGLASTWGLSESGGFLTLARAQEMEERPGTSGRPYPVVEVRVADPDADGVGELLVRSPTVMLGYLGLPDDTSIDADGWLRTGDLGRIDSDGYVYVTGRAKDIVIRGGENVACPHVEDVLARHPDVVEVAVLGIPHEDLGEEVAAVLVVRPGTGVTPDRAPRLRHRLAGQLRDPQPVARAHRPATGARHGQGRQAEPAQGAHPC